MDSNDALVDSTKRDLRRNSKMITELCEVIGLELDQWKQGLGLPDLTALIEWCDDTRALLAVIKNTATREAVELVPRDTKTTTWTGNDGASYTTEVKWRSVRTAVAKDDLFGAVRSTARTVNKETGEVTNDSDLLVSTITKAYRLEPRWTEIKSLGINPDEYCEVRYEPSITTSKTGEAQ